jgi:hypothetical protein
MEIDMPDLEFYGNILRKMNFEGTGYYIQNYASEKFFEADPELKKRFIAANKALYEFTDYVCNKIIEFGGEPDDYEM